MDLLDEGRVRRADVRASRARAAGDARGACLSAASRRHDRRAGADRRHGQPGRRRVHADRRSRAHRDLPRASAGRPPRCPDPCGLRRPVRQAARGDRRTPADRRLDAAGVPLRTRGSVGPGALRVGRLRHVLPRQLLRGALQHAEGHAPCARAERRDVQEPRLGLRRVRQPGLPPDRRPGRRRRQPARRRHRRLVQAVLPDLAAGEARGARRDLSRTPSRRSGNRRPARPCDRLERTRCLGAGRPARRCAAGRAAPRHRSPRVASAGRGARVEQSVDVRSFRRAAAQRRLGTHADAGRRGQGRCARRPCGQRRGRAAGGVALSGALARRRRDPAGDRRAGVAFAGGAARRRGSPGSNRRPERGSGVAGRIGAAARSYRRAFDHVRADRDRRSGGHDGRPAGVVGSHAPHRPHRDGPDAGFAARSLAGAPAAGLARPGPERHRVVGCRSPHGLGRGPDNLLRAPLGGSAQRRAARGTGAEARAVRRERRDPVDAGRDRRAVESAGRPFAGPSGDDAHAREGIARRLGGASGGRAHQRRSGHRRVGSGCRANGSGAGIGTGRVECLPHGGSSRPAQSGSGAARRVRRGRRALRPSTTRCLRSCARAWRRSSRCL